MKVEEFMVDGVTADEVREQGGVDAWVAYALAEAREKGVELTESDPAGILRVYAESALEREGGAMTVDELHELTTQAHEEGLGRLPVNVVFHGWATPSWNRQASSAQIGGGTVSFGLLLTVEDPTRDEEER